VSTILKALEKRRTERERGSEPEAILERNAAQRELARRRSSPGDGPRWMFVLAGICVVLALLCVAATVWVWFFAPARPGKVAQAAPKAARPTPTATPPAAAVRPVEPTATPSLHESVRLRTQPLLRSAPILESPGVYTVGPSQRTPVALQPVATPQPALVFPSPAAPGQSSGSLTSASGAEKGSVPPPGQRSQDPNDFLRLTGIILDPKKPIALINDQIVNVGDVVEGVKVLAINNPSYVQVEYQNKQFKLEMK